MRYLCGVVLIFALLHLAFPASPAQWDFGGYVNAAHIIRNGDGARLYDFSVQAEYQNRYLDPSRHVAVPDLPFPYPAAVGLLFLWTTWLPFNVAYIAWTALSALFLLASVSIWQRELNLEYIGDWPLLAAPLFAPVAACLLYGQLSLLVLFLYSVAFSLYRKGELGWAGFFIGLGALKYQLVLGFLVVLLLRRSWRFLVGASCGSALIVFASAVAVGWRQMLAYPAFVMQTAAYYPSIGVTSKMINVRGLLNLVFGHEPPVALVAAVSILLLVAAAYWWNQHDDAPGFAVAVAVSMITAYHAFPQEGCLLIPLLLLLALHVKVSETVAVALVFIGAGLSAAAGFSYDRISFPLFNLYGAATLLLVAFVVTRYKASRVLVRQNGSRSEWDSAERVEAR